MIPKKPFYPKNHSTQYLRLLFLCLLLTLPFSGQLNAINQDTILPESGFVNDSGTAQKTVFQLIQRKDYTSVTLKTDLKQLLENKKKDIYQKASFSFEGEDGQQYVRDIKVRSRGKSRRTICDFPPLKIKFSKADLSEAGLAEDFNKLKLVTHCANTRPSQQNILKEYLAYQMYNELTENSYRVQLIRIVYEDTEGKFAAVEKWGFIIESSDELAKRIGGQIVERYNCPLSEIDSNQYQLLSVFQYMIGNTDWRLDLMHNLKIVQNGEQGTPKIIPYDFDFCGLVDAKYATVHPDYRKAIFRVKDRLYMGDCDSQNDLETTLAIFRSKKNSILALTENFELLSKKDRKSMLRFLEGFFNLIEKEKKVERAFRADCLSRQ